MRKLLFSKQFYAAAIGILIGSFSSNAHPPAPKAYTGGVGYSTIQLAVNAAVSGAVIIVDAGIFDEDVLVNKSVTISGAGCDVTIVNGVKSSVNPQLSTFQVVANNVVIENMTISRNGNNVAEWNDGLNNNGISINSFHNLVVRYCKLSGNRTGLDINNSNGNMVNNNIIDCNRTGMIFRNNCNNNKIYENYITNNFTIGVLWLSDLPGTSTGTMFYNNNISDNWFAQVENRNTTTDIKNFSKNWLGACPPTTSNIVGTEPGYSAQIPTKFGGNATNPGTAVSVRSAAIGRVKYDPWLIDNVDIDAVKKGFQGDFLKIPLVDLGPDVTLHIGYQTFVTLTAKVDGGSGNLTYLWSTGATTKSINVTPNVQTNYSVTVTDLNTCASPVSDEITVFIKDVRCGNKNDKVSVCHNGQTICISPNAVQAHLNHGDQLGECINGSRVIIDNTLELSEEKSAELIISNFPNPFTSSSRINYQIPFDGQVSIKLFDNMGREIITVLNSEKKAGAHFAEFDGTKLNKGIYFIKVKLGSGTNEITKTIRTIKGN